MPCHSARETSGPSEKGATRKLVEVLLHVFTPLFSSLADALCTGVPSVTTSSNKSRSTSDSLNGCEGASPHSESAKQFSPLPVPTVNTQPESPPPPDRTEVFSSSFMHDIRTNTEKKINEDPSFEEEMRFYKPSATLTESPLPSSSTEPPKNRKNAPGRPRLILTSATTPIYPLPPATSGIAESGKSQESFIEVSEDGANMMTAFFTLPNAVLWEAVAALAECMLMDGPGCCWLRETAQDLEVQVQVTEKENECKFESTLVPCVSDKLRTIAVAADRGSSKKREETYKKNGDPHTSPAHLLADVLLHFERYAGDELLSCDTSGADTGGTVYSRTARRKLLLSGEVVDLIAHDEMFSTLAAALVRSTALHTARILQSLAVSELRKVSTQDKTSSGSPEKVQPSHNAGSSKEGNGSTVANTGKCALHSSLPTSLSLCEDKESPTLTFRVVQEQLKQHHRQLKLIRGQSGKSNATPKRITGSQKKTNALLPMAQGKESLGDERGASRLLPELTARVEEAEAKDQSAFLLARQRVRPLTSRALTERRSTTTDNASPSNEWKCTEQVTHLLDAGAVVFAESAGSIVLALSCVLPERCRYSDADATLLIQWCAGLQRLALAIPAIEATPGACQGAIGHIGGTGTALISDFAASAACLYNYLRDRTAKTHIEHTRQYTSGRGRATLLPPRNSARPTATLASVRAEDRGDEDGEEGSFEGEVNTMSRTELWATAQWSIRPRIGLERYNEHPRKAEKDDECSDLLSARFPEVCFTSKAARGADEQNPKVKRPKAETQPPVTGTSGSLPKVAWIKLSSSKAKSDSSGCIDKTALLVEGVVGSADGPFHHVTTSNNEDSPSSPLNNIDMPETLGEVGAVLACVDAACADRTLQDTSSWRYGRNRLNIAAASFVSVVAVERAENTNTKLRAAQPHGDKSSIPLHRSPSPVVISAGGKGAAKPPSYTGEDMRRDETAESALATIGLYHHETGLLYVSDGTMYALETE